MTSEKLGRRYIALMQSIQLDLGTRLTQRSGRRHHGQGKTAPTMIHCWSRADAFRDGVLVDVSATAREAGIRWPLPPISPHPLAPSSSLKITFAKLPQPGYWKDGLT